MTKTAVGVPIYRIRDAGLEVRQDLGCVRRAGGEEVYLRPKTFQTLLFLLEHRHRVVAKDDIARHVWADVAVTDDAVVQCIVEIRKLLRDDARSARFIRTLAKSGYRFVADVEVEDADTMRAAAAPFAPHAISAFEEITSIEIESEFEAGAGAAPARRLSIRWATAVLVAVVAVAIAGMALARRQPAAPALAPGADGQRKTIAVMLLENQSRTAELDWLREGLPDMLVSGLARSKTLSVIDRPRLEILLARAGHTPGAEIEFSRAVEVARRARLDYFVLGTFSKLGETIRVDLRLHDAAGRLVKTEALTIDRPDDLLRQVDILGWRVAEYFGASPPEQRASTPITTNLEAYRHYSLGVTKANAYHNAEAIQLFTRATELDPQFAMAFARIGYAYGVTWSHVERARPYLAKAYQLADRLSEKDRLQVEAWNALAHLDYRAAAAVFSRLLRDYPYEVEAYSRLGVILAGERRFDEAVAIFQRGLAVDPEAGDLWNRLGGVYDEMGRSDDGIAARRKYVALDPLEPNAHDSLGFSYQVVGRYDEAVASYRRALELKPGFELALVHLGHTYFQTGRYDAAADMYRRYIKAASSEHELSRGYTGLAMVARREERPREALALLRSSSVRPLTAHAVLMHAEAGAPVDDILRQLQEWSNNRGSSLGARQWKYVEGMMALRRGAHEEALELFQAALRERTVLWDADPLEDCLANAYLQLGRLDEAIAEYERILRLNPRYPLAHYRLGLAFERKQRADKARKAYAEFLQVWADADPDVPEILDARTRLAALR